MKRITILIVMTMMSLAGLAQTAAQSDTTSVRPVSIFSLQSPFIGCLSYDEALHAMPQYAIMVQEMEELRKAYNEEMKRVEADFNQKYEAFLEGRKDFPRTIMLKRQTELQQLLQQNLEFKEQSLKQLAETEKQKLAPLQAQLSMAISEVARQHQLAIVVNTDANACPFIEPATVLNISDEVKLLLNNKK
ncbi:MAG: OmpH family outer membrane protein [Prevotella sp.]|nr:OmpH family outer membrane protein [Prevotella sp.]